jgi:hypothetical protein
MVLSENFPSEKSASENSKTNIVPWKALINCALSSVNIQILMEVNSISFRRVIRDLICYYNSCSEIKAMSKSRSSS